MSFNTYYSLRSLIKEGRARADAREVISFDLFDTLLVRRIHDPDLVKLPVARYIQGLAAGYGLDCTWEKIQELRDTIERRQRAATGINFIDQEACYPVFMRQMLEEIFQSHYKETLLEKVTDYELAVENSMLVPRAALIDWLKELFQAGKRILIISDMYFPASHIKKLVYHAGFLNQVEDVIPSADTFLAKASGRAYPMIAEKYSIQVGSWLHIGDNPISDGLRAVEAGIEALIISDPKEEQRKSLVKRYYNYSDGRPFWRGRLLQQLMAPLEGENRPQSALYTEGYNFLGPLIGIFVQQIARLCRQNDITKVFFLSREGWTFKKYWQRVMPALYPNGGLPEVEYLYVSRMALAGASCAFQGLTKVNTDIVFLPSGNRDFRDVCRVFGLDPDSFAIHLNKYGLLADTCLSHNYNEYLPENRKKFEKMLKDPAFQDEVKRQTQKTNKAMQLYFEEVGVFDHKNVAIVDIGWLGTIQRFLFEAISHRDDCPRCFGYLFGATRGIEYPTSKKNNIKGVIYDRHRFDLGASTIFYARDLFEEACRAPYPTLNGYELTDEGYKLVFRDSNNDLGRAERDQDNYYAPLQQGIIESAERFAAAAVLLNYSLADFRPWINFVLVNKLAFPSSKEVIRIRHRHHLDDFHGKKSPKASMVKRSTTLWEKSAIQLRCNPLLRLYYFLRHLRTRLNE